MSFKIPLSIMLEPTDLCQCSCWMCPRSKTYNVHQIKDKKTAHLMEEKLFRKILEDLSTSQYLKLDTLLFHWIGEPFLHPQYPYFLKIIGEFYQSKKLDFLAVETHTNGIMLEEKLLEKIFQNYQQQFPWIISFSLDAFNPKTYLKIRGVNKLRTIYANIHRLIKLREEKGFKYPKIILQFIVQKENFEQILPFYHYWKTFFKVRNLPVKLQFYFEHSVPIDTIFFRTLDYGNADEQRKNLALHQKAQALFFPQNATQQVEKKNEKNSPQFIPQKKNNYLCTCLWQSVAIRWDGNVNLICDIENEMPLGNVGEKHLEEIFLQGKINYYRQLQLEGRGNEIEKCRLCGTYLSPNSGTIQDLEVLSFLKKQLPK